jgi:hypothetical protein
MENLKKRQHYVWKKHLFPWTIDGKIWCKRNNRIFNSALQNVAQERYFYLANPLNDFEKNLLESYINKSHPSKRMVLSSIYDIYLVSSEQSEETQKNGIENYHNMIENNAKYCLDKLYSKDLSILEDKQIKINFSYYLGEQYTRTKRMIKIALNNLKLDDNFDEYEKYYDSEKVLRVLALFIGENIGSWIYSNANISFFETGSVNEFITSDQPIYNLNEEELTKEMELLYPISPHLALLISSKECHKKLTDNELFYLNKKTIQKSLEIIFGSSKKIIKNTIE